MNHLESQNVLDYVPVLLFYLDLYLYNHILWSESYYLRYQKLFFHFYLLGQLFVRQMVADF